jgi:hypothetical protein
MRSPFLLAALLTLPLISYVRASEPDVPWDKLRDLASQYMKFCCTAEDIQEREKKFKRRVAQRLQDNEALSEDSAMRSLMLDWAAANDGSMKRKEKDAVTQACFYFVTFIDHGYLVPEQIRSRLTPDVVKEITDYLEGQIAESSKSKSKN